jgi:hypothetical protein
MTIKTQDGLKMQTFDSEEDASTGLRNAPRLLLVKRDDHVEIRATAASCRAGAGKITT